MKYKEEWKGTIKNSLKNMEGWRNSCLSIEELLCGLFPQTIVRGDGIRRFFESCCLQVHQRT